MLIDLLNSVQSKQQLLNILKALNDAVDKNRSFIEDNTNNATALMYLKQVIRKETLEFEFINEDKIKETFNILDNIERQLKLQGIDTGVYYMNRKSSFISQIKEQYHEAHKNKVDEIKFITLDKNRLSYLIRESENEVDNAIIEQNQINLDKSAIERDIFKRLSKKLPENLDEAKKIDLMLLEHRNKIANKKDYIESEEYSEVHLKLNDYVRISPLINSKTYEEAYFVLQEQYNEDIKYIENNYSDLIIEKESKSERNTRGKNRC